MPEYERHRRYATKIGILAGIIFFLLTLIETRSFVKAGVIGALASAIAFVGGVIPDIDSSQNSTNLKYASKPYRVFIWIVPLALMAVGAGVIWLGINAVQFSHPSTKMGVAIVAFGTLILVTHSARDRITDSIHNAMPPHRKVVHTIWFWALCALILAFVLERLLAQTTAPRFVQTYVPLAITAAIPVGVAVHLSTDKIYSFLKKHLSEVGRHRLSQSKEFIYRFPILDTVRLWRILRDSSAHLSIRILVVLTYIVSILYAALPLDILPDVLIPVGFIDDASVYVYLRETVFTGHQQNTGALNAGRYTIKHRMKQILLSVALIIGLLILLLLLVFDVI